MKLLSYAEEPFIVRPNKTDDCWDVSIVDALIYAFFSPLSLYKDAFFRFLFCFNGVAAVTAIDFGALWRFTCFENTNISVSSHYRNQFIFYSVRKFSLSCFSCYFSIFVSLLIGKKIKKISLNTVWSFQVNSFNSNWLFFVEKGNTDVFFFIQQ